MSIVEFLKPRFVLMENVVDLVKFAHGFLGRYALSKLVGMNYQARMGMMVAGSYGLLQFCMRVFMWRALPSEKLPQYLLPTHNVVARGLTPTEFEINAVAYEEGHKFKLKKEHFLEDALSDLPPVENDERRDEMPYIDEPKSDFQRFIRSRKNSTLGTVLYDPRPFQLNEDDYQRVCQIPKQKGANFRDLPGVRVCADKIVEWDPDVERVPDYAMSFVGGTSSKPFGRLWWDEIVSTVVTRAKPHNQALLHPLQDRVLSIRENARLQGFPDYYKLI